jgi:hypothetical protein
LSDVGGVWQFCLFHFPGYPNFTEKVLNGVGWGVGRRRMLAQQNQHDQSGAANLHRDYSPEVHKDVPAPSVLDGFMDIPGSLCGPSPCRAGYSYGTREFVQQIVTGIGEQARCLACRLRASGTLPDHRAPP